MSIAPLREHIARALPAALLGIVAFALVLEITEPPGPGLDPDAMAYLGASESLAAGDGYRVPSAGWTSSDSTSPLAHFPPGYSTALAIPVRLGMAATQAARLVQALAAGVTTSTLVALVAGAVSPIEGIFAVLALFATPAMHDVHASVLSEPLFLAFVALTLAAMVLAPDRPLRMGLAAALGALTRYAGLSLVGAAALWQLARPGPARQRARRAAAALLPTLVLEGVWVVRTRLVAGPSAIRQVAVYGGLGATFHEAGVTLADWLVPTADAWDPIPHHGGVAAAAGLLLLLLVGSAARRARGISLARRADDRLIAAPVDAWRLLRAAALLLVCYVTMVVVSRLVADAHIPFDERIMSPALLLATTIVATSVGLWWRGGYGMPAMAARVALGGGLLAWWCAAAVVTWSDAAYVSEWGSDFGSAQWRQSSVLEWARASGARAPLYSTWPAAVYFHLHRPARAVPERRRMGALPAFADTLRVRGGRVLAFTVASPDAVTTDALLAEPRLRVITRLNDGVVLGPR